MEAPKQTAEITLKASIADLNLDATDYVLPLHLSASAAEVDKERSELILRPVVTRPTVYFIGDLNAEVSVYKDDVSNPVAPSEFTMILDRDNQGWNFSVEFERDETALQTLVDEYNAQNSTSYTLLPSANYTLSEANFTADNLTPTLTVSYQDLNKLEIDKEYLLPIKMKECTGMSFGVDDRTVYIPVKVFNLLKIDLTADNLWVISDAASDQSKEQLVDGNPTTLYQSIWAQGYGTIYGENVNDPTYGIYMDIDLNGTELSKGVRFCLSLSKYQNNYPKQTSFYGWTGNNWVKIETVASFFEVTGSESYPYSAEKEFALNTPVSKLRIAFESNGAGNDLTGNIVYSGSYYRNIQFSELELWGY